MDIHADWNPMTVASIAATAPRRTVAATGTSFGHEARSRLAGSTAVVLLAALLAACTPRASTSAPTAQAPQPTAYVQPAPDRAAAQQAQPAPQGGQAQADQIRVADLPRQGQITYQAILAGGPFAFDKDGDVFGNRERQLPKHPRGYYREYTVAPAHARSRGAKRIVCGGAPRTPDVCYYTQDHYNTFRQIVN